MNTTHPRPRTRRVAIILALSAAAGVTAGCGADESPESGTGTEPGAASTAQTEESPNAADTDQFPGEQVASAYTGPYDEEFREDASSYAGEQVTLTGKVADLVPSRSSMVLADPGNPDLDPLLVSARYAFPEAEQGAVVEVTGTVRNDFQARVDQVDQHDEAGFYDRHVGQPYLDEASLGAAGPSEP